MAEHKILSVAIRTEHDVVLSRQRARQIGALLGLDLQAQTRLATATSEIARNAYQYAQGGKVDFYIENGAPAKLRIVVTDSGPGVRELGKILGGRYSSKTGMGLGIIGAKRLADAFHIETSAGHGTTVVMTKWVPVADKKRGINLASLMEQLGRLVPPDSVAELQQQNQELLRALEEVRAREEELKRLNSELEDTNRGVVALYAELDDRAEYLRRAGEIKTRFFSNISHELRTPLNSIISLSRLLLDRVDGELSPEQDKQVHYIKKSAEELTELVNDLLDLAKMEAGKITVRPQEFEVQTLFSGLRGVLRPLLANRSVELVFDPGADIPPLHTDDVKVAQILRNLLSNAIKFTDEGEVRVSAAISGPGEITFTVKDTGIGIAEEDQERIFEEWTQIENPAQRRVKGTGLGLPLSKKLAELMGGSISLESRPGAGSTFYLKIPMVYHAAALAEHAEVKPTRVPAPVERAPVLFVEDNIETLYIYEKYLQNSEFEAVQAKTVSQARDAVTERRPVAIVLDILLHDESGWTLLKELKKSPMTQDIPVLVATVVDNSAKAKQLGADAFATKPLERAWLLDCLRKLHRRDRRNTILVIDDEETARYVVKSFLSQVPYEIVEASSGHEGIAAARRDPPAVIVLDLLMVDMTGFEVLEKLKADPNTSSIPVIVHTSKALTLLEQQQIELHAAAFVRKGSGRDAVIGALEKALGSGTAEDAEVSRKVGQG